ncbi:MAG: class I SAM-dependent methyltransferase [Casimicrobium sp.]
MQNYRIKQESISIAGVDSLTIRSLLDRQQFSDDEGAAARMGISSASWPLFGLLWPSGLQLATRIAVREVDTGERILEIGCGLALASLVAHRRGANVTASDCHPLAVDFLRENESLNDLSPMPYRHGYWSTAEMNGGDPVTQRERRVSGRFDLIIGSDILYERDDSGALPWFIAKHANPGAQIWIVDPDRDNRAAFTKQMAALGLKVREERLDSDAHGDHAAYKGRLLTYRSQ